MEIKNVLHSQVETSIRSERQEYMKTISDQPELIEHVKQQNTHTQAFTKLSPGDHILDLKINK